MIITIALRANFNAEKKLTPNKKSEDYFKLCNRAKGADGWDNPLKTKPISLTDNKEKWEFVESNL